MDDQTSAKIMSFKDYIKSFIISKDVKLTDGWGWYIDIESYACKFPVQLTKYHKYGKKMTQYIDYPPTIKEIPSTQSFSNLNELFMTEEEYNKKVFNEEVMLYVNMIGVLGIVTIYYMVFLS